MYGVTRGGVIFLIFSISRLTLLVCVNVAMKSFNFSSGTRIMHWQVQKKCAHLNSC